MSRYNQELSNFDAPLAKEGETDRIAQQFSLVSERLKTMAHPVRMQMLNRLLAQEQTVAWLAQDAAIPPNVASSHLRKMQQQGIIKSARRGKFVCYRIVDPVVRNILQAAAPWHIK